MGFIEGIRYLSTCVIVVATENIMGYTRNDGKKVENSTATWEIIYKPYFKKYIAAHFARGMFVKIKGHVLPYAKEHDKPVVGYSVIGQTLDLAAYPRAMARQERNLTKDPMFSTMGNPDVEGFEAPDF